MVSFKGRSLGGPGTERRRRPCFRRGESPAVGALQGKRERRSRTTFGWAWSAEWLSEVATPRREAAGGGSARRRRCSGGVWEGRPGSGVSVEAWEGGGAAGLANAGRRAAVRGEHSSPAAMGWAAVCVARAGGVYPFYRRCRRVESGLGRSASSGEDRFGVWATNGVDQRRQATAATL